MKHRIIFFMAIVMSCISVSAQRRSVPDFTRLDGDGVVCYWGDYNNPRQHVGINQNRHKIIETQGYDPVTDTLLPMLPEGETKVVKLGNKTPYSSESITYQFTVDKDNAILLLKFAVVFQDPNHAFDEQPRFIVKVMKPDGELVEDCAIYDVTAAGDIPGFIQAGNDVWWRPWTCVGLNLSSRIGEDVIVEFTTYDCKHGGHFGYTYYTASCVPSRFVISDCVNPITVTAPAFFESYLWNDSTTGQSVTCNVVEEEPVYLSCDLTSVTGCEFTLRAALAYDNSILMHDTIISDTICIRAPYKKHYFNLPAHNEVGDYSYSNDLFNLITCEDVSITLNLHVKDRLPDVELYDEICYGESYENYNFEESGLALGWHTFQHIDDTATIGCDSTTILHLYVNKTYNDTLYKSICWGQSYNEQGFHFDNPPVGDTMQTLSLTTTDDCDSIVTMKLNVIQTYDLTYNDDACYGVEYEGFGFTITPNVIGAVTYEHDFTTAAGCDSIVRLNLLVTDVFNTNINDTICLGDSYQKFGFDLTPTQAGDISDSLFLQSGKRCDSIVSLALFVAPTRLTNLYDEICENEVYDRYGFHIDTLTPGTFTHILHDSTMYRCDSTVELQLYVKHTQQTTLFDTICFGYDYHGNGFDIIAPEKGDTVVQHDLSTTESCDSIVVMNLFVAPSDTIRLNNTICFGESYHDEHFDTINPQEGLCTMYKNYESMYGCDSVYMMTLFVTNSPINKIFDTICSNESYHKYNFDYDSLPAGTLYDTTYSTSMFDCDSTVFLSLYVAPLYDTTLYDTTSYGHPYHNYEYNFHYSYFNPGDTVGNKSIVLENWELTSLGCDSIVTMNLYIAKSYDVILFDTICEGEDYHKYNFDTVAPSVGVCIMSDTLITALGGDSIVMLCLLVGQNYDTTLYDVLCAASDYDANGFVLSDLEEGITYDTLFLSSILGCDSVVRLEITVNPVYDTLFQDTICAGEDYNNHGFTLSNISTGWHNDTIVQQTVFGCDSVIMLSLYAATVYDTLFRDTICDGSYSQHGFDLDSLEPGMHLDTLRLYTTLGCDSTVRLELYVASLYNIAFADTICFGEGYIGHGFTLDSLNIGQHSDTLWLTSRFGCDSTVTLDLYVAATHNILFTDTVCDNESYHLHGFDIDTLTTGWYHDTLNLQTTLGCDSIVYLDLLVNMTYDTLFSDTICFGESYHEHGFNLENLPDGWHLDTLYLQTISGCDSLVYLELYVAKTFDIIFTDTICFGESYFEHGFNFETPQLYWTFDTLNLQTTLGCDSIVMLELYTAPVYDTLFTDTICFEDNYYEHGFLLGRPETGWHSDTLNLSTAIGCDSIVRLNLFVGEIYSFEVFDSICEGEDYLKYGLDMHDMEPGEYELVSNLHTAYYHCDSIYNVNLKVEYVYDSIKTIHGLKHIIASTDLTTGKYTYSIDSIPGCDKYIWTFDNNDWVIDTIIGNTCVIYATSVSSATLTVRATNWCSDVRDTLTIYSTWAAVDENSTIDATVYPNPTRGCINVECKNIKKIRLFSNTGTLIMERDYDITDKITMDLTWLAQSIYHLEIITTDGRCVRDIMIHD